MIVPEKVRLLCGAQGAFFVFLAGLMGSAILNASNRWPQDRGIESGIVILDDTGTVTQHLPRAHPRTEVDNHGTHGGDTVHACRNSVRRFGHRG